MANYSNSKLGTFLQCRYKYRIQYIDKVKTDLESIEAFMGKLVHQTMEKLYKDLQFQKINSKKELLGYFDKIWDENWHDKVFIVKDDYSAENYKNMGRKFIKDYYEHYKPFDSLRTIAIETVDFLPLDNGNQYHVRIDRLSCDKDGHYYICDYKTNNQLKAQEELDEDRQLAMYSLWVKQKYPDAKSVKLVWYFLAFDKEMISERSDEQLEKLKINTEDLIKEIEKCAEFPTNISSLCDYCPYKPQCPAWKHEFELKQKTPEQFKDDDGVRLVDEYSKLDEQEKEANEKKEKIREQIINFAQQKGVEIVWGTEKKASVKPFYKIEFPKTDEFIELLKSKGVYDEIITINNQKLRSKVFKNQVGNEIMEYIKTEKGWVVRVSKRMD
ncbi:MAG: PD-(D/E)XK nuclease family protein [Candidatus Omnitrophica bacterium]|nr:PD-(D/E)XK nuclease family protein [Candidatus Omnitrophota bacterium]